MKIKRIKRLVDSLNESELKQLSRILDETPGNRFTGETTKQIFIDIENIFQDVFGDMDSTLIENKIQMWDGQGKMAIHFEKIEDIENFEELKKLFNKKVIEYMEEKEDLLNSLNLRYENAIMDRGKNDNEGLVIYHK